MGAFHKSPGQIWRNIYDHVKKRIRTDTTLTSTSGAPAFVGVYGELLATDIKNDVLVQFQYNVSSYDVTQTVANGGTVASADSMAVVSTSTATNGTAEIESTGKLRYRPGHTAIAQFSALFSTPKADSLQHIGPFNDTDGFYFGYSDETLVFGYLNGGVRTEIPSTQWNGNDISSIDFTKLNVFRINFGWLGATPVILEVMLPGTNRYVVLHSFQHQGVGTKPHVGNPSMPIHMHVENSGNNTDIVMKTGSWQCGVLGLCQECGNRPFQLKLTQTAVGATEQVIAVFENVATFHGKNNKVRAKLNRYQFFVDPPTSQNDFGVIQFRLVADPTLTGTPSWTNIDVDNSIIRYNTNQAYTAGTGIEGLVEWIGYAGGKGNTVPSVSEVAEALGLFLDAGRTYVLLAQRVGTTSTGTPNVRAVFNWSELF